jgi:hypothetical protein
MSNNTLTAEFVFRHSDVTDELYFKDYIISEERLKR